ncbi:hypothetical protein NEUTE2DRAFT_63255, partial [Neurospora tetrasperma FGSC 2509]
RLTFIATLTTPDAGADVRGMMLPLARTRLAKKLTHYIRSIAPAYGIPVVPTPTMLMPKCHSATGAMDGTTSSYGHPATPAARLDTLATVAANSQALPLGCQACHLGLGPSEQQTLARSD